MLLYIYVRIVMGFGGRKVNDHAHTAQEGGQESYSESQSKCVYVFVCKLCCSSIMVWLHFIFSILGIHFLVWRVGQHKEVAMQRRKVSFGLYICCNLLCD